MTITFFDQNNETLSDIQPPFHWSNGDILTVSADSYAYLGTSYVWVDVGLTAYPTIEHRRFYFTATIEADFDTPIQYNLIAQIGSDTEYTMVPPGDQNLMGPVNFIASSSSSTLTYTLNDETITIVSPKSTDNGVHTITLEMEMTDYPTAERLQV